MNGQIMPEDVEGARRELANLKLFLVGLAVAFALTVYFFGSKFEEQADRLQNHDTRLKILEQWKKGQR